jgi:tRNA1(Val) A37 N6-methylase TrmN6
LELKENEKIEDLQCEGLKIIQNKSLYTFTSDSVILANFVKLKKSEVCAEIGTGCGVISILLSKKVEFSKIIAFELQQPLFDLAKRNVKLNGLEDKIEVVLGDVREFANNFKAGSFDVVISNPPYMKSGSPNVVRVREIARHEDSLPVNDLCVVASKMLCFGGRFYLVYSAERSAELIACLIKNNLQPKRMFFTQNGKGRVVLVVIEAVKGGKSGVKVLPELVTNDISGNYLDELHTKYLK